MNSVILIGRMVKAPELRRTDSGKAVVTFALAVDNRRKEDGADFPVCVAWENRAEAIAKYVEKGSLIAVSGSLTTRTFESKGIKRFATEVLVDQVKFLERKQQKPTEDLEELDEDESGLPF